MSSRAVVGLLLLAIGIALAQSASEEASELPPEQADVVQMRRKKSKYLLPMLVAAVLLKSILVPLAFKAMALMSGVSVIMSTFSLLIAAMVGYSKAARDPRPHQQHLFADVVGVRRTQPQQPPHPDDAPDYANPIDDGGERRLVLGPPTHAIIYPTRIY